MDPRKTDFEATFMPCYGRVLQVVHRMVGDRETARELTQEAYLKAYASADQFRGQCSPSTWLCTLAMRLALDWLRRRQRWWQRLPRLWRLPEIHFEESLAARDSGRRLALALPERERSILVLRSVAELSYEEIASALDIPVNQVGVYLQRARARALKLAREMGVEC